MLAQSILIDGFTRVHDSLHRTLPDLTPDAWLHFTCIETANVGDNTVTLKPGATHSMKAEVSIEALA